MKALVWLHEDALRADHPAVTEAGPDAELVYIWDDEYLQAMDYGFKRLVFIYETLAELPVRICKGESVETLSTLMENRQAQRLYIPATANPALQQRIQQLTRQFTVTVVEDVPFVNIDKDPDIKRFFRYWNAVRKMAMQPGTAEQVRDK